MPVKGMPGFGVTRNAAWHAILPHASSCSCSYSYSCSCSWHAILPQACSCSCFTSTVENIVWVCRRKPWGNPAIKSLFFLAAGNNGQFVIRGLFCHGLWLGLIVWKGKDNQSCWHFKNSNALLCWPQMIHKHF